MSSLHVPSEADDAFIREFEMGALIPEAFGHRAHLRVAYVYLTRQSRDDAARAVRQGLTTFLAANGLPANKYHETLTRAWVMAVHHFMQRSPATQSADEFIDGNPELLDPAIMLTHYSRDVLFSTAARESFVPPDMDPIPQ